MEASSLPPCPPPWAPRAWWGLAGRGAGGGGPSQRLLPKGQVRAGLGPQLQFPDWEATPRGKAGAPSARPVEPDAQSSGGRPRESEASGV